MKKTRYYKTFDEDFERNASEHAQTPTGYRYIRSGLPYRVLSFVLYRLIATPAAFIYTRLFLREEYIGKEKLKGKRGYFLYALHNDCAGDAFSPSMISFPTQSYVIIDPDNLYLPVLGKALPMLGGIPLPSDIRMTRSFTECIEKRVSKGAAVTVYPERHAWQGYAGIRPFDLTAFDFPVRFNKECYSATRTFKKTKLGYRAVTYIDGPFLPDMHISKREAVARLHDEVYSVMAERASLSDISPIEYIQEDGKANGKK